jgi:hypothetical protein
MILGRGIVGVTDEGVVFVESAVTEKIVKKAEKVAIKTVGQYVKMIPVGRILALFVDNPVYPLGCSPDYGSNGKYETARHCVLNGDICRLRNVVDMSDGGKANVVGFMEYKACRSWICWVFAKFLNRYGWIYDKCVEEWDNALLDRGNEGGMPDLILFAGSEDGRLGLFIEGMYSVAEGRKLPDPPFRVKVQSVDYWVQGGSPQIVEWETTINGAGLFLVWFGNYVLPFRAYYSYPSSIGVKPGFSGSNAFLV